MGSSPARPARRVATLCTALGAGLVLLACCGGTWLLDQAVAAEQFNWRVTFSAHVPATLVTLLAGVFGIQILLFALLADILTAQQILEATLHARVGALTQIADARQEAEPSAADGPETAVVPPLATCAADGAPPRGPAGPPPVRAGAGGELG